MAEPRTNFEQRLEFKNEGRGANLRVSVDGFFADERNLERVRQKFTGAGYMEVTDPPAADPANDEIRFIGDMQRLELKSGDSLVIKSAGHLSEETARNIQRTIEQKFLGVPVIVLDGGLEIGVMGKG